jgi:pimeloyl-ACP methyl ester carboxylesterase
MDVASQKSTNGRSILGSIPGIFNWPRFRLQLFALVAPAAAQERALTRFLTPPRPRVEFAKTNVLTNLSSHRFCVKMTTALGGFEEATDLAVTVWGRGPAVYLVHGWGGRSSQWSSFVEPLAQAGLTAVVFDAPGHGDSPARRTSIPHFTAALQAVVQSVGPARAVVGHSLGGVAGSLALHRGLRAERIALLGSPADPTEFFAGFLERIGFPSHLESAIWEKFETEYGFDSNELRVRPPRVEPPRALVVHDRDDREVPYASADRIVRVWPEATLVSTSGLGHQRILRDKTVIERVVAFAAGLDRQG